MRRLRRPDWVSTELSFYLAFQLIVASVLILLVINGSAPPLHLGLGFRVGTATGAFVLLVSAIGILRDRWWAYFVQLAIFVSAVIAVGTLPSTPRPKPQRFVMHNFPYFEQIFGFLQVVCFAGLCWNLWKRGVLKWKQRRPVDADTT